MRVYTSFILKNYLTRSDGRDGRDCKPNRLKTFSAPASARLQIGKAPATFFLPFEVSAIWRTRWSSWAVAATHPLFSIKRMFRDSVVRSRPSIWDNCEIEHGPVCASVARTVNWVMRRSVPRKCLS